MYSFSRSYSVPICNDKTKPDIHVASTTVFYKMVTSKASSENMMIRFLLFHSIPSARLVRGTSPRESLVEVYHNKTWGWVCGDQWDRQDADVACRMKGFDGSLSAVLENETCAETKSPVWLYKMHCSGNEMSLFGCVHGGNPMTAEEELVPYADRKVKISTPACTNPKRFHNGDNIHEITPVFNDHPPHFFFLFLVKNF